MPHFRSRDAVHIHIAPRNDRSIHAMGEPHVAEASARSDLGDGPVSEVTMNADGGGQGLAFLTRDAGAMDVLTGFLTYVPL